MEEIFDVWPQLWPSLILCGAPLALAWLADKVFRSRAAVRSLRLRAALLATIALAILPLLPLQLPRPSWLPAPMVARSVETNEPIVVPQPLPVETEQSPPLLPSETGAAVAQMEAQMEAPPQTEAATPRKYLQRDSSVNWTQLATGIWLLGALLLLSWSAWCHAHIARLRGRSQVLAEGKLFDAATEIARDWKMPTPCLLQTPSINSPFAVGVWRHAICWPANFRADDESASWRAILRHEMAHCRRHDCAWNALAQTARALLWPQPLLWWACRTIRRNAEDVCDEAALEDCAPTIYARGLLDLSQNSAASTCSATRTASAGALPSQPELSRRVAAILRPGARDAWRVGWRTRIATVATLSLMIGFGAMLTGVPAQESDKTAASTSSAEKAPVKIDLSTPQATLDTFVAAIKAGDARALVACVSTKNTAADLAEFAQGLKFGNNNLRVSSWQIEQESNLATARAKVELTVAPNPVRKETTRLPLIRLAGGWKIPFDEQALRRNGMLAWIAKTAADPEVARLRRWAVEHGNAVLEGKVLLADGSPATNATVRLRIGEALHRQIFPRGEPDLYMFDKPTTVRQIQNATAITDENGYYRIENLAGATYSLNAFWPATSHGEAKRSFQTDFDARQIAIAQEVRTRENQTVTAPVLKTQPAPRIDVLTVDARDGQPLQGVHYAVYVGHGTAQTSLARSSGADGHAVLNVPQGKIALSLTSGPLKNGDSFITTSRGTYVIEHGSTVQLENRPPISFSGVTTFTVPAGQTRRVTVRLMPMATVTDVSKAKILPPIDTRNPEIKRLRNWAANHGRAILTGQVLAADGSPAAGATVRVKMGDDSYRQAFPKSGLNISMRALPDALNKMQVATTVTDQNGNYRIEGLTGATYWLSAFWPATPSGPEVPYYDIDYNARQIALGQEVNTSEGEITQAPILKTQPTTRLDVLTVDANDGQPLQGTPYVVSVRQGKTITRIERASGADGHAILNVPVGKIGLALASNVSTIEVSGKPRISGVRTSRGPYLNQTQATIQIEDDTPISYRGVNSFTVTAGQTRHITIRLMPLATP